MTISTETLIRFVEAKKNDVFKQITARIQAEQTLRGGTDVDWKVAADLHSSTKGKSLTSAERVECAEREHRIVITLNHEFDMLDAILDVLRTRLQRFPSACAGEEHNPPGSAKEAQ